MKGAFGRTLAEHWRSLCACAMSQQQYQSIIMSSTFLRLSVFLILNSLLVWGTHLNVVRQDSQRVGYFEKIDTEKNGEISASSNVAPFAFSWPLIQMTSNTKDHEIYAVTYPDNSAGPVLFLMDESLQLKYTWDNVSFSYFDLQYSNLQSTLYGIYVSSTYGRVLSNFTMDQAKGTVSVNQLFTLPYMWYVNASSFHHATCHYYALINYFPGHPESTLDQQLVVADFSQDSAVAAPKVTVSLITNTPGILQFIAYADSNQELYFAGMVSNQSMAMLGTLNTETGAVKEILLKLPALAVGPMVVDDLNRILTVFVKDVSGKHWQLWSMALKPSSVKARSPKAQLIQEYDVNDKLQVFAAGSLGF